MEVLDLINPLYEHYTDKNNKKCVQISCTAYIVYTFHLSLNLANFAQFNFFATYEDWQTPIK